MLCPYCHQPSRVLETRPEPDHSVWRRHRCTQGHDFTSTQVLEARDALLERRNRQIVEWVLGGRTMAAVAASFGLRSHAEVSRIVKRAHPKFNARRAGQLNAWRKRKSRPKAA